MKAKFVHRLLIIFAVLLANTDLAKAQTTAFTYQGLLDAAGSPANGNYDLRFGLFPTNSGGTGVGSLITNTSVPVSNGVFTVTLDYGNIFGGDSYWLEIGVRTNGSTNGFTTLTPRQNVTGSPYSLYALAAGNVTGVLAATNLPADVALLDGNANFAGTITTGGFADNGPFVVTAPAGQSNDLMQIFSGGTKSLWVDSLGNLNLPSDANLLMGGNEGSLFWNPAHPGGGELQFTSQGSMSINVGYGRQGDNTLQIGSSGGTHENVNFQYDVTPDATHPFGYSKMVNFIHTFYSGGVQFPNAYPQLRGEAVDLSGDGQLAFYNPGNVQAGGYGAANAPAGDVLQGAMFTNGWLFNNIIRNNLLTTSAATNFLVDFGTTKYQVINLTRNTTFIVTNTSALSANQTATIRMDLFPSISSFGLAFPTNWMWLSESGVATGPTNIQARTFMRITLDAEVGTGVTNYVARYALASYSPVLDTNAVSFFNAVINNGGSLSATESNVVNAMVLSLKSAGLWTTADSIYPMVGGSAASMAINLANTNNYKIAWHGTNNFTTNGATGDGFSGYGDTGINPYSGTHNFSLNSASIAVYTKTTSPGGDSAPCFIGTYGDGVFSALFYNSSLQGGGPNDAGIDDLAMPYSPGFIAEARTGANATYLYQNSNSVTGSVASINLPNNNFYLMAVNEGSAYHHSNANISFAWIGGGLTTTQMTSLNNIITAFETSLGRQ